MTLTLIQNNEYRCSVCGAVVTLTDEEHDDEETKCPECGSAGT